MKKLLALLCVLTCAFGLTACGSEDSLTDYEQQKVSYAETVATEYVIPYVTQIATDTTGTYDVLDEYTADEVAYFVSQNLGFSADGYAFMSAISSFSDTIEEIGGITAIGECETTIDDDQIVVNVTVYGTSQNANAEIILSNDFFLEMESASLSAVDSFGVSMQKAALNTLMGMGTVFAVLILISGIIYLLSFVPKLQSKMAAPKSEKQKPAVQPAAPVSPIVQEEPEEAPGADELELAAVIAAAVAAYEGCKPASGFVVRSIKRRY